MWDWYEPVLRHYKLRIDKFLQHEKAEDLIEPLFQQDLEELSNKIETALKKWTEEVRPRLDPTGNRPLKLNEWEKDYGEILDLAKSQFKKDYETFKQVVDSQLCVNLEKLKELYDKLQNAPSE
jgi:hypothetical protein